MKKSSKCKNLGHKMHNRRLQNQFQGRYVSVIGLESAWLGGFAWSDVPTLARSGYFLAIFKWEYGI